MMCWICNQKEADSGEHRFKKSLIKAFHGKPFTDEVLYYSGDISLRLEGSNNKKVKFPRVICSDCNGTLTSTHDKAFDKFIAYGLNHFDQLYESGVIDFKEIYGDKWSDEKRNLYKYLAKHAGCKVVTAGREYDVKSLANFILSDKYLNSFNLKFILKQGFHFIDTLFKDYRDQRLRFMSNSPTVYYVNDKDDVVYFAGMTTYNWISIAWVYTQNQFMTDTLDFSDYKEAIEIYPFSEIKGRIVSEGVSAVDSQRFETVQSQVDYYHAFLK